MNIELALVVFALALFITSGVVTCNSFRLRRLETKLEGKANIKKPRPRGRFVPVVSRREDESGSRICQCSRCFDVVPAKGHTLKQCEASRDKASGGPHTPDGSPVAPPEASPICEDGPVFNPPPEADDAPADTPIEEPNHDD